MSVKLVIGYLSRSITWVTLFMSIVHIFIRHIEATAGSINLLVFHHFYLLLASFLGVEKSVFLSS